jgi:hypothetical protein
MFQTKAVEKTKTINFKFNNFSENRAVYEIMWKNMVESDGPQQQYNTAHALCLLNN